MKKYLILGGNGFLGKHIIERLEKENKILVADYNINDNENTENIKYQYLDFSKCNSFDEYMKIDNEPVDVVIHLISTITPNDDISNINKEIMDNVIPTVKLLNSCVKMKIPKIVFLSSGGAVYGEHDATPINENEIANPICNYGIIKYMIEKYLDLYFLNYGLNYSVVRLANPYSEKVKNGKKQGIIPIMIDQILRNETIKIWGDGEDIRDYIYIDDAIDAIIDIINYDGNEKIFNVGTGLGCTINQLIEIIKNILFDYDIKVEYCSKRNCDVKNNILSINKINKELGWYPKVKLIDGINKIINDKLEIDLGVKYGKR